MKEVYVNAYRVVAWLGDSHDAGIAVRMMDRICKAYGTWTDEPTQFYKAFKWQGSEWQAFLKLVSNDYFSRAWICQEAGLGSDLQFYVGGHYIRPEAIYDATGSILRGEFRSNLSTESRVVWQKFVRATQNWHAVYYVRQAEFDEEPGVRNSPRESISLGLLLSLFSRHEAKCSVDKIYSLLRISETDISKSIVPDYGKSQKAVFEDTAVRLIRSKEDATYLLPHAGIGYRTESCGLPTWVPDWEAESKRATDIFSIHVSPGQTWFGRTLTPNLLDYKFSASHESQLSFTVLPDLKLRVAAIQIDVISEMTEIYDNDQDDSAYHISWLRDAEKRFERILGANTSYGDVFWRTLVLDGSYDTRPCPESWGKVYQEWRLLGPRAQVTVDSAKIATLKFVSSLGGFLDNGLGTSSEDAALLYGSRFADSCGGRLFCTTENRRIGLAAPTVRRGDVISIILGLQVPYVLRWCDLRNGYQLVGECYIHGVMYGETVPGADIEYLAIV